MLEIFKLTLYWLHYAVGSGLHEGSGGVSGVSLLPGDNVEVVEGELKGLEGKVISAAEETITILPKHEDLKVRWMVVIVLCQRGRSDYTLKCTFLAQNSSFCTSQSLVYVLSSS